MAKALPLIAVDRVGPVRENAPLMLHIRLAEMYRFSGYIGDPGRVDELHAMRIAAKRLRYTMEIFAPALGDGDLAREFDRLYRYIKSIQEKIGEIHDADVRGPLLQEFLDRHGAQRPEIRVGLERLIAAQRSERDQLYDAFIVYWNRLQKQGLRPRFLHMLGMGLEIIPEENIPADE